MFWFCFGMISALIPRLGNVHEFCNFSTISTDSNTMPTLYSESSKNLLDIYETYDGPNKFDHWKEYAEKYERNLQPILLDLSPEKTFRMLGWILMSGVSDQKMSIRIFLSKSDHN